MVWRCLNTDGTPSARSASNAATAASPVSGSTFREMNISPLPIFSGHVSARISAQPCRSTIHDIDSADGIDFIAMEFVAGKALDRLIPRQGLRLNEVLKYSVQITDALVAAHKAGIVHRDLKPGNVMVTERRGMLVSPAKHRVKIALPGYQAFETEVNLLPRQKITIKTNLVPGSITQARPSIKKD